MPDVEPGKPDGDSSAEQVRGENETASIPSPERVPPPFELALEQYAASIERWRAQSGTEMDPFTRGFVAGLRAAIKVAVNAIKS